MIASAIGGLGEVKHLRETTKDHILGIDATVTKVEAKGAINMGSDGVIINFGKIRYRITEDNSRLKSPFLEEQLTS